MSFSVLHFWSFWEWGTELASFYPSFSSFFKMEDRISVFLSSILTFIENGGQNHHLSLISSSR